MIFCNLASPSSQPSRYLLLRILFWNSDILLPFFFFLVCCGCCSRTGRVVVLASLHRGCRPAGKQRIVSYPVDLCLRWSSIHLWILISLLNLFFLRCCGGRGSKKRDCSQNIFMYFLADLSFEPACLDWLLGLTAQDFFEKKAEKTLTGK